MNHLLTSLIYMVVLSFPFKMIASDEIPQKQNYSFTGTLYAQHITTISSQVQGRLLEVFVDVGDYVKKGQVVASLDPLFYEMDLQKMEILADLAKISYEESELDYTRMKKLWEKQEGETSSISKKQYEDSIHKWQEKKLQLNQAQIELKRAKNFFEETKIKAPYDGVITQKFVDPGEAITTVPVTPIFEIMDISSLRLEFSLPQDLLPVVRQGQEVILEKNTIGSIEKIFPNVDVSSRSFKCRVIVDNSRKDLRPGLFVKGALPLKKSHT